MLTLGLKWTGSSEAKIQAAARALLAAQKSDGGWAPNSSLASDAYHTGQALYALFDVGALKPADAAFRKGVDFLLKTQRSDGSWYVKSRAPKFQPYFESGFPYGHDQWISNAATAWAVMGLAPAAQSTTSRAAAAR
jgi:squalene cyclase